MMSSKILHGWAKHIGEHLCSIVLRRAFGQRSKAAGRRRTVKPGLEPLEDRLTPTTVTPNTANLPDNAPAIIINGSNFDPNPANDSVAFNSGVAGYVSSVNAAGTTLTVNVTAPPVVLGPLTAVVTAAGVSSGAPVQVATEVNANWQVTDPNGNAGSGSLSDVTLPYAAAHSLSGDSIVFAPSTNGITIDLAAALTISHNVTILGNGPVNTLISGNNAVEVFHSSGIDTIDGVTIENGSALSGAGILNDGTLTLSNDAVSNNGAINNMTNHFGAGIDNDNTGTVTISGTTVNSNVAFSWGGGIYNAGTMTLSNSTVYGNAAYTLGGGIYNSGILTISDATVAGNYGWNNASYLPVGGGGVYSSGTLQMDNTIVAGNGSAATTGPDVDGTIAGANYDLIGNPSGATYSGTGNLTGSAGLATTLAYNNGAPTQTLALTPGSQAIGSGDPSQAGTNAQNGIIRPAGAVDIGAFQGADWVVTDPSGGSGSAGDITLPYAVANAQNGDVIAFAGGLGGQTIVLNSPLVVSHDVTITGLGSMNLAVSGGGFCQVFNIAPGANVSISGLTIENGNAASGGGIYIAGTLALSNCTVTQNSGGGISNAGTLTLSSCNIFANAGPLGVADDVENAAGATLIVGNANAFTSSTNINNVGTLNLSGSSVSIGTLTGNGTITNSLTQYQIDNFPSGGFPPFNGFNNTLGNEPAGDPNQAEDNWVGNVFTAVATGTQLQSITFYNEYSALNAGDLPNPNITAALYAGAPGAGLALVPGSVNTVPLNANAGTWITVPFASMQNIPAGQQFTAALLIDNVPNFVFPWTQGNQGNSTGAYYDVDNPNGAVNTYNVAAPNDPTLNAANWGNTGDTNTPFAGITVLRVNQTAATLTVTGGGDFTGTIQDGNSSNTIALTVAGTGQTLTLSGFDPYSGLTTINSGDTLLTGSPTALTSNTSVADNGTLDLAANNININALSGGPSGTVISSGALGTLTVNGGGSFAGNFTGASTALTIAPSTLILLGINTYGGLTTINLGDTLQAGSATALSPNSSVLDNGTLDIGGFSNTIDALSGTGVVLDSGAAATFTVSGGGSFSGAIQDGSGPLALTVGGTSQTLTLSGASTYTGQTMVNSTNSLLVDGSETSAVNVGGTLGGTGAVGDLSVAGGTVDPGDPVSSTGTLSANSADFSSAGDLNVEITGGSPTNDLLSVTGAVTLGGTSTLNIDLTGLNSTGVFTIVTDGSQTGQFANVNVLNNGNGYVVTVGYTGNAVTVTVALPPPPTITAVKIDEDIPALWDPGYGFTPGSQRSMVNDIVYTFSEAVNIVAPGTDPNVFTVTALTVNGITGTVPTLSWAAVAGSGSTEWAVTFSGAGVDGGSIADGAYDITVNHPSAITAVSDLQAVSITAGIAPGTGDPDYATQAFFRLFGDINGNGIVNAQDNAKFKLALAAGGYNAAFDWDANGSVNALDNAKFKHSLASGYNFLGFTATI